MRILMADPNETFLEVLQSYLWNRGHEAEIAIDGLECIAMLRDFVPDVLVMERDLRWGGCDGVLTRMSEEPSLAKIPTILTADNGAPNASRAFVVPQHAPIVGWLYKPFRLVELLASVTLAQRWPRTEGKRLCGTAEAVQRSGREREHPLAFAAPNGERCGGDGFGFRPVRLTTSSKNVKGASCGIGCRERDDPFA